MNADAYLNLDALRQAELKRAMGCFATGVTVVATRFNGDDVGMTCNSFNTGSLEPPLVLWSIRKASASRAAFTSASGYTVSILAAHQQPVAERFARSGAEDRFNGVATIRLPGGRLRIAEALAWFDCDLEQSVDAGDHHILIGRVTSFASRPGDPLLYIHGGFDAGAGQSS